MSRPGWMISRKRVEPDMITVPLADWLRLCDSVPSETASRVLGASDVLPVAQRAAQPQCGLSDVQIETLLNEHYRQVLASPAGRKVWRKLLRETSAAQTLGLMT